MVTFLIVASIMMPILIARPVVMLVQAARESFWFAETYGMSRQLGNRMLFYAGAWVLGGVLVVLVGGVVWQLSSPQTRTSGTPASSSCAIGPSAPSTR